MKFPKPVTTIDGKNYYNAKEIMEWHKMNNECNEIIVKFKDNETKENFIAQMMDGFGENFTDFTHWYSYEEKGYVGINASKNGTKFRKMHDRKGRLICFVNEVLEDKDYD